MRVIQIELQRGLASAALNHWQELASEGIPLDASAKLLVAVSLALRERDRRDEAASALRCALERSEDKASRALAARIARAARGLDAEVVEVAAWRALGSIELGLNERRALENLIAEVLPATGARSRTAVIEPTPEAAPAPDPPVERPLPAPIALARERVLTAEIAVPVGLGDAGIDIDTGEEPTRRVAWEQIDAVSLAAVEGLGPKHVMLLDLVLNWRSDGNSDLEVIRLRGDRYDPRRLVGGHSSNVDALREFVETILERTNATPLPDEATALGRPFASFPDLETYERAVLSALSDETKSEQADGLSQGRNA